MSSRIGPLVARPKRPSPVLVCAKCLKRADRGRAVRAALKAEIARAAEIAGGKRAKLVATRCLGLCPKGAVTVASGATLARGRMLVVRREAEVPEAVRLLGDGPPEPLPG